MDRSDCAEAIVAAALVHAGFRIVSWDQPAVGFHIDPDIVAERRGKHVVVLVNASDSFFASQKKIWRNIEEPFEARVALGLDVLCISVAFITPAAKNAIFGIASQLFDATFLLCDRIRSWEAVLEILEESGQRFHGIQKSDLAKSLVAEPSGIPALDTAITALREFFLNEARPASNLLGLWRLDVERVREARGNRAGIVYASGQFQRKGIVRAALLGIDVLEEWERAGLGRVQRITLTPSEYPAPIFEDLKRGAIALQVHGAGVSSRALGGRVVVSQVQGEIVGAFKSIGAKAIGQALRTIVGYHPELAEYIDGARNLDAAIQMARIFSQHVKERGGRGLADAIFACSTSTMYEGVASNRNWILDLALIASGLSQTTVQRTCGIGRLTHVATGQMRIDEQQARRLAEIISSRLPQRLEVDALAKELLVRRLYSLETHSYANPVYATVLATIEELLSGLDGGMWERSGFPDSNGAVVESWHTEQGSSAGQVKVQFRVRRLCDGRELIVRVGSCHDGNVGNKRKEVAGKGRVLSYGRSNGSFYRREDRRLVLVLDGEWEGPMDDPMRHVRMMHEAGWQHVLSVDAIGELRSVWSDHFGTEGGSHGGVQS